MAQIFPGPPQGWERLVCAALAASGFAMVGMPIAIGAWYEFGWYGAGISGFFVRLSMGGV